MEPSQGPVIYVANMVVWEVDEDSFCVAGRRFFMHGHDLKVNDLVRITIEKVPDVHTNHDSENS